ncbi:MAG: EF-hand domain-containing protein [Thermonemataceae bacterium]|nr:EF-hand domain-containing protein [Thermonemataceae bacterium]
MLSSFQNQKIEKLFTFFDADGNKMIEPEDMDIIAEQFTKLFGWQIGDENDKKFRGALKKYWRRLLMGADTDQDQSVDLAEFKKAYEKNLSSVANYEEFVKPFIDHIFPAIDTNKDNVLQPEEFALLYEGFRNPKENATKVFVKLDTNADGSLSKDEIYQHFYDFHFSEDKNAAGNNFFGEL